MIRQTLAWVVVFVVVVLAMFHFAAPGSDVFVMGW